jgi:hypothetical protein
VLRRLGLQEGLKKIGGGVLTNFIIDHNDQIQTYFTKDRLFKALYTLFASVPNDQDIEITVKIIQTSKKATEEDCIHEQ